MNEIPKGGRAFPTFPNGHPGMSLRDWFAGMALQGLMACPLYKDESWNRGDPLVDFSKRAYQYADAMISEREKTP